MTNDRSSSTNPREHQSNIGANRTPFYEGRRGLNSEKKKGRTLCACHLINLIIEADGGEEIVSAYAFRRRTSFTIINLINVADCTTFAFLPTV